MNSPNILLYTIDALRFDAAFQLTALSGEKWSFFRNHYGVAHCSDPNYLAILTGWSPDAIKELYGVEVYTQMGSQFKKVFPTLPVALKKLRGYSSWAYQPVRVPRFYLQGFDIISWAPSDSISDPQMPAIRKMLKEMKSPWFGFVRVMDCHYPYLGAHDIPKDSQGEIDTDRVKESYWKSVQHSNEVLKDFLPWVLESYPNTVIILLSDHGESLGEHGIWDHLYTLYEVLVHVPLWIYLPDQSGRNCSGLTQHTDIVPTFCELVGLELEGEGQSWLPFLKDESPPPDREEVSLVGWGCHPLGSKEEVEGLTGRELWKHRAIRSKSWKYIVNWHQEKGANFQLFNLEKDPGEVENVISMHPDLTQHFVNILRRIDASFPMPTESSVGPAYSEIDREIILARLQALGYA